MSRSSRLAGQQEREEAASGVGRIAKYHGASLHYWRRQGEVEEAEQVLRGAEAKA